MLECARSGNEVYYKVADERVADIIAALFDGRGGGLPVKYDIIVVGGGPAGLAAAIQARARDRSVLVVTNEPAASPLCKAPAIENYPGIPHVSGLTLVERMLEQAKGLGAELRHRPGAVRHAHGGELFCLHRLRRGGGRGGDSGPRRGPGNAAEPGEAELLGRGVSYCATCDGMFYRGRPIVVAGNAPGSGGRRREYLRSIGCQVTEVRLPGLSILGTDKVTGVRTAKGEDDPL